MGECGYRAGRAVRAAAVMAGLACLGVAGPAGAAFAAPGAVPAAGAWGKAVEVPGLGTLNAGGSASVTSVSCGSAGNCAAGGDYLDGSGHFQVFVADERHGRWGTAIEVPSLETLNAGGFAGVRSVSCASAGNCAAGGDYRDGSRHDQGFVADERHGRWGKAIEVPGLPALNTGGVAHVLSVSCAWAGNCAAGGEYYDGSGHFQGFVAVERHGRWDKAILVPGLLALNAGGDAGVSSVSCPSAGNCAAGGDYTDSPGHRQGFVADERNGRWGKAIRVPGLRALNAGGVASVQSVSCASAGNCAAGGDYRDGSGNFQGFVAVERHGRWGKAIRVPGLRALNAGGNAQVSSVSCASAGNCAVGGEYLDGSGHVQGFVVSRSS